MHIVGQRIWRERDHLEDLDVGRRRILKCILKKWGVNWFSQWWLWGLFSFVMWCDVMQFARQAKALLCLSLHKDTTSPQPNHTVMPTHIEPEQYTHTQLQAPEDECTIIRNMLSKK